MASKGYDRRTRDAIIEWLRELADASYQRESVHGDAYTATADAIASRFPVSARPPSSFDNAARIFDERNAFSEPPDPLREAMYDAGITAVLEEWEQLGWDADVTRAFVQVIIDEALATDDTLAVFRGDAQHPDWGEYVARNLLQALHQVPDTGDWHGALRAWCERNLGGSAAEDALSASEGSYSEAIAERDALAARVKALEAENERLRALYENVTANRERFGFTINHLLECEDALAESQARAAALEAQRDEAAYDYRATNGPIKWYHRATFAEAQADLGEAGDGAWVERRTAAGSWERVDRAD